MFLNFMSSNGCAQICNVAPAMSDSYISIIWNGAQICSEWMPRSTHRELYSALICGTDIQNGQHRQLFIDTGLIHLLVVSGAHLVFLEQWLEFLPPRMRLGVLGIYSWLTGFGAPVVRAWARRAIGMGARRSGFSVLQLELITVGVLVALHPSWLSSRSFLMCWMCALAIALPPLFPRWPNLSLSLLCYLLLLPFCPSTPATIAVNVMVTPYIGGLLLPLCALTALIPYLTPITDGMWDILLALLAHFPTAPPPPWITFSPVLFLIPLTIHTILLFLEVPWRRARAFS